MGTLASNRKGYIQGASAANYGAALVVTTGTAYYSQTTSTTAIQYFKSTGRGGGTFRFIRTFIHFDTSGISGGSSFQLQLTSAGGNSNSTNNVVAIKHSAGTGNGSELANSDFDNIDRSTVYSSSTAWASSGTVTISLNSSAATQITGNNDFNIALLLFVDQEEQEEDPLEEDGDISNGIAFGSTIQLSYTDPTSGYSNKIASLAAASINKVSGLAVASVSKVNGVD